MITRCPLDGSFISRREWTVINYSGSTVWLGFLLNSPALLPFSNLYKDTILRFPLSKDYIPPFCYFQRHNWCVVSPGVYLTIAIPLLWLGSLETDGTIKGGMHASYSSSCISVRTLSQFNIGVKQNKTKKTFLTLYKGAWKHTEVCKLVRVQDYEAEWDTNISHHTRSPPNNAGMRHAVLLKLCHTACNETRQRGCSHGKSRVIAIPCELPLNCYYSGTCKTEGFFLLNVMQVLIYFAQT